MSRSRRKCIDGKRLVITNCGCDSLKEWKRDYNRAMRRENRQMINQMDFNDIDNDSTIFIEKPHERNFGDEWTGPGDGWAAFEIDGSYWPVWKWLSK